MQVGMSLTPRWETVGKERISFLYDCNLWKVIYNLVDDHTSKSIWEAQVGLNWFKKKKTWDYKLQVDREVSMNLEGYERGTEYELLPINTEEYSTCKGLG